MNDAPMPDEANVPLTAYSQEKILAGMSKPKTASKRANGAQKPSAEPARLIESADSFLAKYVPIDYIVDGFLIRGYLYALTSKSNGGKTAVSSSLALHIATGTPFAGMEISSGRVLMMYGENPDNSRVQFKAAVEHFDLTTGNIDVISRKLPLAQYVDQIIEECKGDEYAFVMVDSSAAFYSYMDENDNVNAKMHADDLRRLTELPGKPAVMVLCHPTKSAEKDTLTPRGGGAFENEVDTSLRLWKTGDTTELYMGNKVRGPVLDPLTFEFAPHILKEFKDAKGRPVILPVAVPMGEAQAMVLRKNALESDNRVLFAMLRDPDGSMSDWAHACGWFRPKDGKPYRAQVSNCLKRLADDRLVSVYRGKYVLTELGKKEAKLIA